MDKKTKTTVTFIGAGLAALGIWYFTRPETAAVAPVNVPPPNSPPPPAPYIPPANTPPGNTQPTELYPIIKGTAAKVGDKLWASGTPSPVFKNVNPGERNGQVIPPGNYAGQVMDISPYGLMKMQMFSGAPVWDDAVHTTFYLLKSNDYTKRP